MPDQTQEPKQAEQKPDDGFRRWADRLADSMTSNLAYADAHNDEVDERAFKRSLKVKTLWDDDGGSSRFGDRPEPPTVGPSSKGLNGFLTKGSCEQGQTAAETGCTPASGEGARGRVPSYVGESIQDSQISRANEKMGKKACGRLDHETRRLLDRYAGGDSQSLNSAMRGCPPDFKCLSPEQQKIREAIEAAVSVPLAEPATVYRGLFLTGKVEEELLEAARKAVELGGDFQMPSLTSTSFRSDSTAFIHQAGIVFQIKARTGLPINSISQYPGEQELLQSSRVRYRVVGVADARHERFAKNKKVIYLEEQEWSIKS